MANEGIITLNDLQTKFNAAGVYTIYRDLTAQPAVRTTPILRLVVGSSRKGIFNVPVYIEQGDFTTAEILFGAQDKSLERKGSFFHRALLNSLEEGPVLALNLLKLNNETSNGVPTSNADVVPYKSFSTDVADANGIETDKLFSSYYDKERFWKPSAAHLLATRDIIDDGSILNLVNLSQNPISFIIRKSQVKGFDVTAKEWYGDEINKEIPPYVKEHDLISDYYVDVIAIQGNFGADKYEQLSVDPIFGNYFDVNGLIISELDNFLSRKEVNTIDIFTGSLIANFKDKNGVSQFIETIINRSTRVTGILAAIDRKELDKFEDETNTKFLDLVGHRLLTEPVVSTDFLSYKKKIKEDLTYTEKTSNATDTLITEATEAITGVTQGTKTFTVGIDISTFLETGSIITVSGSTANDGDYTVVSATENSGNTDIIVEEAIPDATIDGDITYDNVFINTDISVITIRVPSTNADFADVEADVELGTLFQGETTAAGTAAGIAIANPVLKVTRILKTSTLITFDVTSPLKDQENTVSGSFVDLDLTGVDATYETENDKFFHDGTATWSIAEPGSQIYKDFKDGDLTNGDKITDNTLIHYIKVSFINDATDFRELAKIEYFTDTDLLVPISAGAVIDFGDSYDSNGYAITDPTLLNYISLIGALNERFDIVEFIDQKTAKIVIANELDFKIGQYLVGKDSEDNLILTRITSVKRTGSPTPTHILVETAGVIKPFVTTGGQTQVERYLPLVSFFDRFNITHLKGFTIKETHLPNNTNARMKDIQSVMTDTNLFDALTDPEMVDFRYYIDTFNHGLESQSKRHLTRLCMTRQRCLGILNTPSKLEFSDSESPRFTSTPTPADPLPTLNVRYIRDGGNLEESPDFLYTLPEEEDGASYVGFFFPNINVRDDDGDDQFVPPAAFVGNKFMQKYRGGNPFLPVAGPRRGVLTGNGLIGVEYPLTKTDRGLLEEKGINPIYQKKNGDIQIMGNETAFKRFNSVLNNLNTRDTLITLTIDMENILDNYTFEFNDDNMKTEVTSLLTNYLNSIQNGFGAIVDFDIVFDRNNNPNFVIRENAAIVDVIVEPVDVVKKFVNRITLKKDSTPSVGGFLSV